MNEGVALEVGRKGPEASIYGWHRCHVTDLVASKTRIVLTMTRSVLSGTEDNWRRGDLDPHVGSKSPETVSLDSLSLVLLVSLDDRREENIDGFGDSSVSSSSNTNPLWS